MHRICEAGAAAREDGWARSSLGNDGKKNRLIMRRVWLVGMRHDLAIRIKSDLLRIARQCMQYRFAFFFGALPEYQPAPDVADGEGQHWAGDSHAVERIGCALRRAVLKVAIRAHELRQAAIWNVAVEGNRLRGFVESQHGAHRMAGTLLVLADR